MRTQRFCLHNRIFHVSEHAVAQSLAELAPVEFIDKYRQILDKVTGRLIRDRSRSGVRNTLSADTSTWTAATKDIEERVQQPLNGGVHPGADQQ